jgi:hypothetical protein
VWVDGKPALRKKGMSFPSEAEVVEAVQKATQPE